MSKKDTILRGTFILTVTGFLSRFIGFFYRIFLSRTFGEEGVGLYQLVFPIFALGFSFTSAGIEVALSRLIAQKTAIGKQDEATQTLFTGLLVSFSLSIFTMLLIQRNVLWITEHILRDTRCERLLIVMSYIFPFSSIHSCICGYYLGLKQTKRIAISQLIEQMVRVLSVYLICMVLFKQNSSLPVTVAVAGLVLGEIGSAFYCIFTFKTSDKLSSVTGKRKGNYFSRVRELLSLSIPLTANRVLLNVLQGIEAVSIPGCLILSGLTNSESLSLYGILTGMAMPCIFFPSALTGSIATMLLPTIAEVQARKDHSALIRLVRKATGCVFSLGAICTVVFLLFGNLTGTLLFQSKTAGDFITTLAWICPFMYTNTTLISILNGLGKASSSFRINTCGLFIRIGSVFFLIPLYGILGYLWGLLGSQIVISFLSTWVLKKRLCQ